MTADWRASATGHGVPADDASEGERGARPLQYRGQHLWSILDSREFGSQLNVSILHRMQMRDDRLLFLLHSKVTQEAIACRGDRAQADAGRATGNKPPGVE